MPIRTWTKNARRIGGVKVDLTGLANNDMLKYNSSTGNFECVSDLVVDSIKVNGVAYSAQDTETQAAATGHAIDWSDGNSTVWDLQAATGNITVTMSNPVAGASYVIKIVQSSTARTITWPAAVLWAGGAAPTISTGDDAIDLITLYYDGTYYLGAYAQDFS